MDRQAEKEKRRLSRKRNLAHKDSLYKGKGHRHASRKDYKRPQRVNGGWAE